MRAHLHGMRLLAAAATVAALAGCAVREPSVPHVAPAAPAPELPVKGAAAYRVVTAESELRVRIHRAGPLSDVGHEHVATTSDIGGRIYLHERWADSGFELRVPLRSLTLDAPAAREEEGFESLAEAVRSELQRAFTRISAVVLISSFPSISADGVIGRWVHTEYIPQNRPAYPLPSPLAVPGGSTGTRWLQGEWRYFG